MKVYVCTDFEGHFPVGVSAVVVAEDSTSARQMLAEKLADIGLPQLGVFTLDEINLATPCTIILQDGNY